MSIVRYVNKKTGRVAVYESTSHYDPEKKQSRPRRKYLGTEDPETGELIPSSGKRGRKRSPDGGAAPSRKESREDEYKEKYEKLLSECRQKDAHIKELELENKRLSICLAKLRDIAADAISTG